MLSKTLIAVTLATGLLAGCGAPRISDLASLLPGALPVMRWDGQPEAATWTAHAMRAVARHDAELAGRVPADIDAWCPGYESASLVERRAFWVGLMSMTAKMESSFNPRASGGGGRYLGLMQISTRTAKAAGCEATSSTALKDGAANLECAVRVFAPHVAENGVVAGNGRQGMARDWGPFTRQAKRAEIAAWTKAQPWCQLPDRMALR